MGSNPKESKTSKVANIWTRYINPLRTLNTYQIEQMLNQSRFGNDTKLQLCFYEIEKNSPIFSACINKRIAGVQSRNWDIVPIVDSSEAKKQAEIVKKMFDDSDMQVEDNLTDAIRHLTLGTFRGRAAVKPFIENGRLIFKRLNNWNYLNYLGKNYWNPEAYPTALIEQIPEGITEIPREEICYVVDDKPLDWIGLTIYLRLLIGEESWARFIEKEGIPQVIIKAPDGTPENDLEKWNYRALSIYEGGSGTLPFGSEVDQLTVARGQDPFTSFLTHQAELFCILATGGALDTLAGTQGSSGTGMGSSTADHQNDLFQSLVNYDCKRISNAMQVAVDKCINAISEGAKTLCRFQYVEHDDTTPQEYIELAEKCKAMGMSIDIEKLKELTGLQFISDNLKDIWTPIKDEGDQK